MQVGVYVGSAGPSLDALVEQVRTAADAGLDDSAYFSQLTAWDALTAAAVSGERVPRIGLGTAVVPTYPRHPLALASQALTTQAATRGRLTVGIGPSHAPITEGVYGYPFDRPAGHVREYLTVLGPLLRGERVDLRGRTVTANGQVDAPVTRCPCYWRRWVRRCSASRESSPTGR